MRRVDSNLAIVSVSSVSKCWPMFRCFAPCVRSSQGLIAGGGGGAGGMVHRWLMMPKGSNIGPHHCHPLRKLKPTLRTLTNLTCRHRPCCRYGPICREGNAGCRPVAKMATFFTTSLSTHPYIGKRSGGEIEHCVGFDQSEPHR